MHQDDLAPPWLYRSEAFAEDLEPTAGLQAARAPQARRLADWAPALGQRLRQGLGSIRVRKLRAGATPAPLTPAPLPGLLQPR
jgi:hypothetical protein